jgi:hypothetical protein
LIGKCLDLLTAGQEVVPGVECYGSAGRGESVGTVPDLDNSIFEKEVERMLASVE